MHRETSNSWRHLRAWKRRASSSAAARSSRSGRSWAPRERPSRRQSVEPGYDAPLTCRPARIAAGNARKPGLRTSGVKRYDPRRRVDHRPRRNAEIRDAALLERSGSGEEVLLLLHGWPATAGVWKPLLETMGWPGGREGFSYPICAGMAARRRAGIYGATASTAGGYRRTPRSRRARDGRRALDGRRGGAGRRQRLVRNLD